MGRFVFKPLLDGSIAQNGEMYFDANGRGYFKQPNGTVVAFSPFSSSDLASKADKSVVDSLAATVGDKADQSALQTLAATVGGKADQSAVDSELTNIKSDISTLQAGGGSGGGASIDKVQVQVTGWAAGNWVLPNGVTAEKAYSDTSLRITHNKGKVPVLWSAINNAVNPKVAVVPDATRNMQVVDDNTVIITSIGVSDLFDINLIF